MATCTKCGRAITDAETPRWDGNERVCGSCHRALVAQTERVLAAGRPPKRAASAGSNVMGLVGFILSIVSLIFFFGVASPISLIFSLLGLKREPRGLAIAGTVISSIGTAVFIFVVSFYVSALVAFFSFLKAEHHGHANPRKPPALTQPAQRARPPTTGQAEFRLRLRPRRHGGSANRVEKNRGIGRMRKGGLASRFFKVKSLRRPQQAMVNSQRSKI